MLGGCEQESRAMLGFFVVRTAPLVATTVPESRKTLFS
jgi:hypothetical protein